MPISLCQQWLRFALGATAALAITACSQGSNLTTTPSVGGAQAAHAPRNSPLASQAKAMLALAHHGANHAVIEKGFATPAYVRPAKSAGNPVYDSIVTEKKGRTSSYIASLGFECCSTKEFGDGLVFTRTGARLNTITVVLSSWGCESGFWNTDDCLTTAGAKFEEPITANVYAVSSTGPSSSPEPGTLLATKTKDFYIPYRPSANNQYCNGPNLGAFLGPVDKQCDNGLAVEITFNFKLPKVILPSEAIVTLAYNTSDAGYSPYGQGTSCFTGPGGCGYDSLNVSAWGNGGFVGSNVDPNGVFVNFGDPYFYCNGTGNGSNALQLDTPCWTGYHPEIDVTAVKS